MSEKQKKEHATFAKPFRNNWGLGSGKYLLIMYDEKWKCALLPIFLNIIFPRVQELVGPGGKYEGYTPVFQGDNAGPHQNATYVNAVTSYCEAKGWHWEPQAPQMPHMNVLDLSVFDDRLPTNQDDSVKNSLAEK